MSRSVSRDESSYSTLGTCLRQLGLEKRNRKWGGGHSCKYKMECKQGGGSADMRAGDRGDVSPPEPSGLDFGLSRSTETPRPGLKLTMVSSVESPTKSADAGGSVAREQVTPYKETPRLLLAMLGVPVGGHVVLRLSLLSVHARPLAGAPLEGVAAGTPGALVKPKPETDIAPRVCCVPAPFRLTGREKQASTNTSSQTEASRCHVTDDEAQRGYPSHRHPGRRQQGWGTTGRVLLASSLSQATMTASASRLFVVRQAPFLAR